MGHASRRCGGFHAVEMMVVCAMVATVGGTIGIGLRSGRVAERENERRARMTHACSVQMERLFRIPFGAAGDAPASGAQVAELFDGDDDPGTTTLASLAVGATAPGFAFSLDEFANDGEFQLRVSDAGGDLLRIELLHDGIALLSTLRARPQS